MMDVALAILLLVLLAPLFAAIYVVVRADGGTALFPHRRIGRHGVPFDCLKFRTMRPNSDTVL